MREKIKLCPLTKPHDSVCSDCCAWSQDGKCIFVRVAEEAITALKSLTNVFEAIEKK